MFRIAAAILMLSGYTLLAQETLMPVAVFQGFSAVGQPLAGGMLYTCVAGSTCPGTPQTTYKDAIGTPNSNPIVLDGGGFASVWLQCLPYKLVLEDSLQNVIWTADNVQSACTGAVSILSSQVLYNPGYAGSVNIPLNAFLGAQTIDVRSFGAQGYTGSCHSLTADDSAAIQNALNYAYSNGPLDVTLPNGYCWPIGYHIWVPPTVRFHGFGRTTGYEVSSAGSLLIANANWSANNTSFPYSQMLWETGANQTSGTYLASGGTFAVEADHMEVNCNDQVGCGNLFAVGRQEKSSFHDILATGGVPFGSGGYSYGFYEAGVDCNGSTPPTWGCLIGSTGGGNPYSGQQGPDYHLEIFPSYNAPLANFILFAEMGANNYKGLRDSTLNDISAGGTYGGYFWGEETTFGPGVHVEGTPSNQDLLIGNIPAGSGCNGGSQDLFVGFDGQITIGSCMAQQNLTFISVAGGVQNNQNSTTITAKNYMFSTGPPAIAGWPGIDGGGSTNASITLFDPAEYVHNGYNGLSFWNGTNHSGMNLQVLLDANSNYSRGYLGSSIWWNHATGLWNWSNNGGTSYSSLQFINGGAALCNSATTGATFSMATLLGQCQGIFSNSNHLLLGSGWINTANGLTVNEGSDPLQVAGNINLSGHFTGSVQFASAAGCSYSGTGAGSTCSATVTFPQAYSNNTFKVVCNGTSVTGPVQYQGVISQTTNSATVQFSNGTASQAVSFSIGGVSCIASP